MKIFICIFIISLFFSSICLSQRIRRDSLVKLIRGEWNSLQDSSYHINFVGNHFKEHYRGGKKAFKSDYTIESKSCDSILNSTLGTGYFLVRIEQDKSTLCYAITDISNDYLELVYAGGRVLSFKRAHTR
jgi:hypothetical protein